MDQPPSVVEKALKRITTQLECSVCLETYTDAKLLPCFHSFCKNCLERLVVQDRNGRILTCPNCRQSIPLPPAGVSGLQTDFHIEHLFEIRDMLSKAKDPQKMQCEKCEQSLATGFCRNCGQFVCNKCTELHQTWKEFRTHQIASLSVVQKEAANLVPLTKKVMYCQKHPENILKIYCETCGELICNDCTIRLHQGHNYDLVTDTFPKHKEEIVSSLQPVKQQLATVNKAVQALDTRTKEIEDQRMTVEADIHKHIDCLQRALEQRRTELIGQLDRLTQQKLKGLAAQRDRCELVQTQLSSCLDYVEGSLKTGSEEEILAMKTPVLKQIAQIIAEFNRNTLAPVQEANIQFVVDDSLDLLQTCKEFAGVESQSACPEKCYTTGDGPKTATVGEEATVTLHARNKDDRECTEPIQNLTAELVCIKDGTTVGCQVKDEDRSKYVIKYKPTSRGNHELHIKIKGKSTKGSPFTVRVRPPLQTLGNPIRVIGNVNGPYRLTTNSEGHIIVVEYYAACVSLLTPEGIKIQSFGSYQFSEGWVCGAVGVAVDNADNIYVLDNHNHRIQKFTSMGDFEFTVAVSTQGINPMHFYNPNGIGFNKKNGKLYVCDQGNYSIEVLETNLTHYRRFGSRGNKEGQLLNPSDVAFDNDGNVYVVDCDIQCIQTFSPDGHFLKKFGTGRLQRPLSIAVHGDMVYVTENENRISVFSTKGEFLKSFGKMGGVQGQFSGPNGVTVDANGFILVADMYNRRIQIF